MCFFGFKMQRFIGSPLECHILLMLKYVMYFYINIIRSDHFFKCRKDQKGGPLSTSLWVLRISESFWFLKLICEHELWVVNFIKNLVNVSACVFFWFVCFFFITGRLVIDYRVWLKIQLLMRSMESQKKISYKGI